MRLKEIKPGMVIHCKNNEEKKALLEEAERLGYRWINGANLPTDKTFCFGMTIHFYNKNEWKDYKHIAWSDKTDGVTEFSNLIMPEITADEVVEWLVSHYEDGVYVEAFGEDYKTEFLLDEMSAEEVVRKIAQWKYAHEKKEPEIETVDICRIIEIQPDGRKRCVHEEDIKPDPELPYGYERDSVNEILKRYCMEHEGEFIAVHEVVSRVRK